VTDKNAQLIPLTEELSISPQPSTAQLKNLNLVGIKSVLNIRLKTNKHEEINKQTLRNK